MALPDVLPGGLDAGSAHRKQLVSNTSKSRRKARSHDSHLPHVPHLLGTARPANSPPSRTPNERCPKARRRPAPGFFVPGWRLGFYHTCVPGSLVSPILIGRRAESDALDAALAGAIDGEAAAVVVGGEAGVGKSRLIAELVTRARAAGARALLGGCVELDGGGIPFAPVVDMFRLLATEIQNDDLEALLGPARAELGRLVPELDDGQQAPAQADRDPSRILELLLGVIGRLAAAQPLLLVFEDVQWADPRPDCAARRRNNRTPVDGRLHGSL